MSFADHILTEDLEPLRQRLLSHPLWMGIEEGTLPPETLRVFALQDWWLVREAYRLDALAVAGMPDLDLQDLLLAKLVPKIGGYQLLLRFGEALGLAREDFDAVEPLAGLWLGAGENRRRQRQPGHLHPALRAHPPRP